VELGVEEGVELAFPVGREEDVGDDDDDRIEGVVSGVVEEELLPAPDRIEVRLAFTARAHEQSITSNRSGRTAEKIEPEN
jgi:hypothetical protein